MLFRSEPLVQRLADQLSPAATELAHRYGLPPGQTPDPAMQPGTLVAIAPDCGLVVATSGCPVLVKEAQLEGKSRASGAQLLQQLQAQVGDRLGD